MPRGQLTRRSILFTLACFSFLLPTSNLLAGSYLDSAHGSSADGVFRPIIGNEPFGYSQGNCAHCHEQHASIGGSEPNPASGVPSSYELFAKNFDTAQYIKPYAESDNFCFYCHNNPTSAQAVLNNDYSQNFGCGSQGQTTILSTMNQISYHNLWDIRTLSMEKFSWFNAYSNPCNACHNPHLARRNWANTKDITFSAISKPTDHFNLWGTTETMDTSYLTKYEPPFCSSSLANREPDASADATAGRANTPDYVAFCTTCHTSTNTTIWSTTLNRDLVAIDWSNSGDKHGELAMDGSVSTKEPYDPSSAGTDFVLSCLDCHEAHGTENVMLLRRRANGSDLSSAITSLETSLWGLLCVKCHKDDASFGDTAGKWEHVHHLVSDAPYDNSSGNPCMQCHTKGEGFPIDCQECHSHSGTVTEADTLGDNIGIKRIGF